MPLGPGISNHFQGVIPSKSCEKFKGATLEGAWHTWHTINSRRPIDSGKGFVRCFSLNKPFSENFHEQMKSKTDALGYLTLKMQLFTCRHCQLLNRKLLQNILYQTNDQMVGVEMGKEKGEIKMYLWTYIQIINLLIHQISLFSK